MEMRCRSMARACLLLFWRGLTRPNKGCLPLVASDQSPKTGLLVTPWLRTKSRPTSTHNSLEPSLLLWTLRATSSCVETRMARSACTT
jgi:hypothetical protein